MLLKMGDDISTDEIMPAGAAVLPLRSNIPEISRFAFSRIDSYFYDRAMVRQKTGLFVVGGIPIKENIVLGRSFDADQMNDIFRQVRDFAVRKRLGLAGRQ